MLAFAVAYHLTVSGLSGTLKEHLPKSGDVSGTIAYYKGKLRGEKAPPSEKYLPSERITYVVWAVLIGAVAVTGCIKVAAHICDLPAGLMGATTFLHNLAALGILIVLVLHIIAGAVVPWSWPLVRSMVTGYISEDYTREVFGKWYEEIKKSREEKEV